MSALRTDPEARTALPSAARLGAAQLRVRNIADSVRVWRDLIGLVVLRQSSDAVELGAGGRTVVVLRQGASRPAPQPTLGLFHVAIKVPARPDLARAVARLHRAGWDFSAVDHIANQSVYLSDPDGLGIELMVDTLERGRVEVVGGRFRGVLADGSPHAVNGPLDVERLLAELPDDGGMRAKLPPGTCVGHVHLSVAHLDRTMAFYAGVIGFKANRMAVAAGMYDTALGAVSHAVAFNNWAAHRASASRSSDAGLDYFSVEVPSAGAMHDVAARLDQAGVNHLVTGARWWPTTQMATPFVSLP